ncbi:MAG: hypothetical protein ABW360_09605 [Phenylobacterium sp.]
MADQAEMDVLRAELRALGRRLTDQQMLELAELMLQLAGVPDEPRSWAPKVIASAEAEAT